MQVQSLGQEDPWEKEMATHSSILVWEIPWTEELAGQSPRGCKELDMTQQVNNNNNYGFGITKLSQDFNSQKFI